MNDQEKILNRRQFFKYTFATGVGTAAVSYSPPSEAFAFTAAGIATGEAIGEATKPLIERGKDMLLDQYNQFIGAFLNASVETTASSGQNILTALQETLNSEISRGTAPMPSSCDRKAEGEQQYASTVNRDSIYETFYNTENLNYKEYIASTPVVNMESGFAYSWNSFGDGNIDDVATKANVVQFYLQLGYTDEFDKTGNTKNISSILRRKLARAILNNHLSNQLTDYHKTFAQRVDSTFHSEDWRHNISDLASPTPLAKELIMQIATENQVLYEILLSKQRLLTLDCLVAIAAIKNK
jgi:hypothetical protein